MQIIRSKKTIGRLNNHRFFNPVKLIAIAEKRAQAKQTQPLLQTPTEGMLHRIDPLL